MPVPSGAPMGWYFTPRSSHGPQKGGHHVRTPQSIARPMPDGASATLRLECESYSNLGSLASGWLVQAERSRSVQPSTPPPAMPSPPAPPLSLGRLLGLRNPGPEASCGSHLLNPCNLPGSFVCRACSGFGGFTFWLRLKEERRQASNDFSDRCLILVRSRFSEVSVCPHGVAVTLDEQHC